jgi:hypothetical protein
MRDTGTICDATRFSGFVPHTTQVWSCALNNHCSEVIVVLCELLHSTNRHTNDNLFVFGAKGILEGVPAGKELLGTGVAGLDGVIVGVEGFVFLFFEVAGELRVG